MYVNFWELSIAFSNGGLWAPFNKVCPPLLQTSSYATGNNYFSKNEVAQKLCDTGYTLQRF